MAAGEDLKKALGVRWKSRLGAARDALLEGRDVLAKEYGGASGEAAIRKVVGILHEALNEK